MDIFYTRILSSSAVYGAVIDFERSVAQTLHLEVVCSFNPRRRVRKHRRYFQELVYFKSVWNNGVVDGKHCAESGYEKFQLPEEDAVIL